MLRTLRRRNVDGFAELNRVHFAAETSVLLAEPDGFRRVLLRATRLDTRLVLGLLKLIGRPIGEFYAVEADGRLAGTTLMFYDVPAAHLANVVVDTPYRGRGFAKRMLAAAERDAHHRGCRNMFLEVLEGNAPAIALYQGLGYRSLRTVGWFARDLGDGQPPLPAVPDRPSIRPFRRGDGVRLAELANARMSAAEREIRPVRAGAFRVAHPLTQVLGGATDAFVLEGPTGPAGFVRASTALAMGSGHLTSLLTAPGVPDADALALLDRGLAWFAGRPARRIICEAPEDDPDLLRRLASRGFHRALGAHAFTKPIAG